MHGNCCGICCGLCSHICHCTSFSNETREEDEDAAEAQSLKQLEEEEDKLLASEESSEKEREERENDARATEDAKEAAKMAQERDERAANDAQATERDEEEARQDKSKQQEADQERGRREKEERDKGARERLAAEAERERARKEREARSRLRDERDREEREARTRDRTRQEQAKKEERRKMDHERRERERAEWAAERADSSHSSLASDPQAKEPLADMINHAYQSIFGPVGTSPLHALCLSCAVCDDLMMPLVERTCGIEVWLGEEVWEGADAGLFQLMTMSPCVFDRHRLPLHAACSNGFCPTTCLALVLHGCSDALWKKDGDGMTPLALLCTSHPPPLPSPRSAALSSGMDSSREAQGERNQVCPTSEREREREGGGGERERERERKEWVGGWVIK